MTEINKTYLEAEKVADLLLDIATYLLASGAHSGRVERNVNRIANEWGFSVSMNILFTGVSLSIHEKKNSKNQNTQYRKSPTHVVHFDIISKVSLLSWKIHDEHLSFNQARSLFNQIKEIKHYNTWIICLAVGLSCAGLCSLYGGDYKNSLAAFVAAFIGYRVRFLLTKMNFNLLIIVTIAAFVSSLITCLGAYFSFGSLPEAAIATGVLYLIPGVPLINSVIDLIEGYSSSSVNRMLFSGYNLMCIAVGMTLCITLFGISNFI